MQSITCIITFMVMTLFYALCAALPHEADFPVTLPNNFNFTDTGVSRAVTPVNPADPNSIWSVPNVSPDVIFNKDRCFHSDGSEKWSDVGGKYSQFVHDSIFHMCDIIATFASNTGLRKDDVMKVCKPVDKNTQGKDYDRSIGMTLIYRGPDALVKMDRYYCWSLMSKANGCDAGGAFVIPYGGKPYQWFEATADPNRHDCASNGYEIIM